MERGEVGTSRRVGGSYSFNRPKPNIHEFPLVNIQECSNTGFYERFLRRFLYLNEANDE